MKNKSGPPLDIKRCKTMAELHDRGYSFSRIAARYNISKARAHQLVNKYKSTCIEEGTLPNGDTD